MVQRRTVLTLSAVTKGRVPITSPLGSEVEDMPNRAQEIDAALFNVARQRRMSRVEVTNGTVIVPSKDGNGRVLISLAVFAPEIVFERIVATTQEP